MSPPDAAWRSDKSFHQYNRPIPGWYFNLDNYYTVIVIRNTSLLTSIRQSWQALILRHNAGTVLIDLFGKFKGYGTVWCHPKVILNILFLSWIKNIYCVTYDRMRGNCFAVHKRNSSIIWFMESPQGLCWINTKDTDGADGATILNVDNKSNSSVRS